MLEIHRTATTHIHGPGQPRAPGSRTPDGRPRCRRKQGSRSSATSSPASCGSPNRSSKLPAFPVWHTAALMPQRGARHVDAQDFARVRDGKITQPVDECWPALRNRMLGCKCTLKRAELGV